MPETQSTNIEDDPVVPGYRGKSSPCAAARQAIVGHGKSQPLLLTRAQHWDEY